MTVAEGAMEKNTEGKTSILVGVQMDGDGHDLLSWAIGKIAEPGDLVIAATVHQNKSDLSSPSVKKVLDNYLAEYETLCNLKQVNLVGRLPCGKSIKKTLVKEATLCNATVVVVGVNKNTAFRGPSSLAKYCAKKLPPTTSLFAIHCGKVVFERKSTTPAPGAVVRKSSSGLSLPALGMISKAKVGSSCSFSLPAHSMSSDTSVGRYSRSMRYCMDRIIQEQSIFTHTHSVSVLEEKLPDPTPGWPLLHRSIPVCPVEKAARKMSVVQWAMSLPNRSQPSPEKQLNSDLDHSSPSEPGKVSAAYADLHKQLLMILETNSPACRWFTHAELEKSTNQFSPENLIGNGGCSRVYMGYLPDGLQVAVKITKLSEESFRDFLLEADIITTLQHQCIISLLGISIEGGKLISVYKFFCRGSLEENLHGKRAKPPLPWDMRFKVAIRIAEALHYLHGECPRPVIHRDIKSSNILLSDDFEPQLSDFGLAIWAPENSSCMTQSDVFGTFGYLAPEYFMYGKVSDKIDVYSFGVVLLELLTGRKPIDAETSKNQESLVMWVTKMLEQGDLIDSLDPSLEPYYNEDQMQRMVLAATVCIRRIAQLRPRMSQVLSLLRGDENIESWMESYNAANSEEDLENQDEESYSPSSVASHLGLALQDVDDATSISSMDQNYHDFIEKYLQGRWSRSSSFN